MVSFIFYSQLDYIYNQFIKIPTTLLIDSIYFESPKVSNSTNWSLTGVMTLRCDYVGMKVLRILFGVRWFRTFTVTSSTSYVRQDANSYFIF